MNRSDTCHFAYIEKDSCNKLWEEQEFCGFFTGNFIATFITIRNRRNEIAFDYAAYDYESGCDREQDAACRAYLYLKHS